ASPPALEPLDRLAMTLTSRGQGEPTENERTSDHPQGEQVGAGEGQRAITGCGRADSRAVAGSAAVQSTIPTVPTVAPTLGAGTEGAAAAARTTGRGGVGVAAGSHSVALRPGSADLQQGAVAGDERE